jgi:hypothetical protein
MTTRHLLVSSIAALALAAAPALNASPLNIPTSIHASYGKTRMVQISFRNDSGAPLELKVGESVMKIEAGKTVNLHLAVGTRVLANTPTPNLASGSLIAQVDTYLNGATLSIK